MASSGGVSNEDRWVDEVLGKCVRGGERECEKNVGRDINLQEVPAVCGAKSGTHSKEIRYEFLKEGSWCTAI